MSAAETIDPRAQRDIRLCPIPTDRVEELWPQAYPLLAKADIYTSGRFAAHTVKQSILSCDRMLLLALDVAVEPHETYAAFVAEIAEYELGPRVFSVILAGGSHIDRWRHLYPAFREIARHHGCSQLEITGRRGWGRFLPKSCRETSTTFIDEAL